MTDARYAVKVVIRYLVSFFLSIFLSFSLLLFLPLFCESECVLLLYLLYSFIEMDRIQLFDYSIVRFLVYLDVCIYVNPYKCICVMHELENLYLFMVSIIMKNFCLHRGFCVLDKRYKSFWFDFGDKSQVNNGTRNQVLVINRTVW